jgi:hypothetical protein
MARCSSISQLRCKPLRDFDAFSLSPLLVSLSVLAGYIVLGAAWLHLEGTGALRTFAERTLRLATPVFLGLAAAACIAAALVQPRVQAVWTQHYPMLIVIVVLFVLVALMLMRSIGGRSDGRTALCVRADAVRAWCFGTGIRHFPRHRTLSTQPVGGCVLDTEPCLLACGRRDRHASGAWLLSLRLSRVPRQDAAEGMGSMTQLAAVCGLAGCIYPRSRRLHRWSSQSG